VSTATWGRFPAARAVIGHAAAPPQRDEIASFDHSITSSARAQQSAASYTADRLT
jgi:hypothetical protein